MPNYGTNVVHNYGSDAILNAWRLSDARNRQNKTSRNNAITKAILQGASSGDIKDFKPGNPAYTGIERKFGPQLTEGIAAKGRAAKAQAQLEQGAKNFEDGMKFFNTANSLSEKMGTGASAWTKKAYAEAGRRFKALGMDVDMSHLYDTATNVENFNDVAKTRAAEIVGGLSSKSSVEDIAAARLAIVMLEKNVKGADVKDMVASMKLTIKGVEESIEKEKTRSHQLEYLKKQQTDRKPVSQSFQKLAYADWRMNPENKGKNRIDFLEYWDSRKMDSWVRDFTRLYGREPNRDEIRVRMLSADKFNLFGSPEPKEEYSQTATNKAGERMGLNKEGEWVSIP